MLNGVPEVRIVGGDYHDKTVFIPRIILLPTEGNMKISFHLKRHRFPVRLVLSIAVNETWGQPVESDTSVSISRFKATSQEDGVVPTPSQSIDNDSGLHHSPWYLLLSTVRIKSLFPKVLLPEVVANEVYGL